jgi:hypothetical protein
MLRTKEREKSFAQYMGRCAENANPDACGVQEIRGRSPAALCKQRIGSGPVGGDLAVVRPDPRDLGFEQRDPFVQFGLRVGAEILGSEATRRVSFGSGEIGFFH